jgi:hypothetical protein
MQIHTHISKIIREKRAGDMNEVAECLAMLKPWDPTPIPQKKKTQKYLWNIVTM